MAAAQLLAAAAGSLLLPQQWRAWVSPERALAVYRGPPVRVTAPPGMQMAGLAFDELGESWTEEGGSSVGVLLLSVGSPETPDDVEVCLLLSHELLTRLRPWGQAPAVRRLTDPIL